MKTDNLININKKLSDSLVSDDSENTNPNKIIITNEGKKQTLVVSPKLTDKELEDLRIAKERSIKDLKPIEHANRALVEEVNQKVVERGIKESLLDSNKDEPKKKPEIEEIKQELATPEVKESLVEPNNNPEISPEKNIKKKIVNIIFKGGGAKGIAHIGAVKALEEYGVLDDIQRVGGSSAGAIMTLLLGLNFSSKEMDTFLTENFGNDYIPAEVAKSVLNIVPNLINHEYGLYNGEKLKSLFTKIVRDTLSGRRGTVNHNLTKDENEKLKKAQTKWSGAKNFTFKDIKEWRELTHQKPLDIFIVTTNLTTEFSEIFSTERSEDRDIVSAVCASIAIPILFTPKKLSTQDSENHEICLYIDGGCLNNYPIDLFDKQKYLSSKEETVIDSDAPVINQETLGFFIDAYDPPKKINNAATFLNRVFSLFVNNSLVGSKYRKHEEDGRTVYLDTGKLGTIEYMVSKEERKTVVTNAEKETSTYLERNGFTKLEPKKPEKTEPKKYQYPFFEKMFKNSPPEEPEGKVYCNIM